MLLLAALALTATPPGPAASAPPPRQARASVRIVRASPIHFEDVERRSPTSFREAIVRSADGESVKARLIEFE